MGVLELVPEGWLSWSFDLLQDGHPIAEIDISRWREKGVLTVEGVRYDVYREGFMSGAFILDLNGAKIARAEKPSAVTRSFNVNHGSRSYQWKGEFFRRSFILIENDRTVGSLTPAGMFTRRATAAFPEDLRFQ